MENLRQLRVLLLLHVEPVLNIMPDIVAKEWPHGKRIVHHGTALKLGRSGRLRLHARSEEHAMIPVERLVNQRNAIGPSATEEDRLDRHALGFLPVGINNRTLADGRTESGVGVGRLLARSLFPLLAKPVGDRQFVDVRVLVLEACRSENGELMSRGQMAKDNKLRQHSCLSEFILFYL